MTRVLHVLLVVLAAAALEARAQGDACGNCGTIQSIKQTTASTNWTPLGAMTPGTLPSDPLQPGQVTTSFVIGKGLSNDGMVVLGSAGGAGYAKRPNSMQQPRWEVTVKMDRGPPRVLVQPYEPMLQEGDRVQVFGSQVELYNP
jgi:outer membrane lipoprotein SlyB